MSIKRINKAQLCLETVKEHYDELSGQLYEADMALGKVMEPDAQPLIRKLLKITKTLDQAFIDLDSALDELNNYESDYEPPNTRAPQTCELCGQHFSQCKC